MRDWSQPIPKKMRRGALRSALSERLREGNLIVVDEFTFGGPKTKEFVAVLDALGFGESKTLIVDALDNDNLVLSARNVKRAKVVGTSGLNIYDVLYHEKLVLSRRAAEQVALTLDPKRKGGGAAAGETEAEAGANDDAAEAEEAA
jgi:large subunit ribosomal protein L4